MKNQNYPTFTRSQDVFAWDLYMLHGLQAINQPRSNGGSALLRKLARRFGQHQSEGKRSTCLFNVSGETIAPLQQNWFRICE